MLGHLDMTFHPEMWGLRDDCGLTLIRTKAPQSGGWVVTLDEVKAHIRIDHNEHDAQLRGFIDAACQNIDGWDGWLGRAILTQEWELRLDGFFYDFKMPLPPLITVDSVKYVDSNGTVQTVLNTTYEIIPGGTWHSRLKAKYGVTWPSPRSETGTVRIAFTAGYGNNPMQVPAGIKHAIMMMVAHWYENREAIAAIDLKEVPMASQALLAPFRVSF